MKETLCFPPLRFLVSKLLYFYGFMALSLWQVESQKVTPRITNTIEHVLSLKPLFIFRTFPPFEIDRVSFAVLLINLVDIFFAREFAFFISTLL